MPLEAWLEFRRTERHEDNTTRCYHCGEPCSGDTTEYIPHTGEQPICDEPDDCPANFE